MSNKIALDALTKFVKNAEQSVFEDWLEAKSPSGDVEQVRSQWESSNEYREFCEREWAVPLSAAIAALEAMEAGGWLPLDSAPKDGTYIHVQQQATYRWLPYKQASQEFKRGKKGRWQRYTGYGFDNADLVGSGWMNAELPTPPKD